MAIGIGDARRRAAGGRGGRSKSGALPNGGPWERLRGGDCGVVL